MGIGLDGFPLSLARRLMETGRMPNLRRLEAQGTLKEIRSVYPTVSNVAWSAFQTGVNPGGFGVFGFVELKPDFDLYIPNATHLKAPTIWRKLSEAGRRVVALSVPMTYPAPSVKGLLVSGFLAPRLDEEAVSGPDVLPKLRKTSYEIDIDPSVAHQSLERFQADLTRVSRARQKTALALMESEKWDLFFVHVMDTDRVNHFIWKYQREPESREGRFFFEFYEQIDAFLGEVADRLDKGTELMILSDHGFCDLRWEFQLNRWLREEGYLDCQNRPEEMFRAVRPGSVALALVPGRVHILTESRWKGGGVPDAQYESVRAELMAKLRAITHPDTGERVCRQVMAKEDVFSGPHVENAPDIVIDPCDGYDLKAKLGDGELFTRGVINGMHTCRDAILLASEGLADVAEAEDITGVGARTCDWFF